MSSSGFKDLIFPIPSKITESTQPYLFRDMCNGFLIAEIISRYEPGKIPMHAFQNSQNQARRDNNWNQLTLFFKKCELRKIKIEEA